MQIWGKVYDKIIWIEGGIFMIIGIPLIIVGETEYHKYLNWEIKNTKISLHIEPSQITLKF